MFFLHVGDHTGRTLSDLVAHLLEPEHALLIATAIVVGVSVYRVRRRRTVRPHVGRARKP